MKSVAFLVLFILIWPTVFAKDSDKKVTVAVAANMQYAMNALKANFEKKTGIKVEVILGSSGKLTQQIQEGAPFDVFISADTKYPQMLWQSGLTPDAPKIYAKGVLVLWTARADLKPAQNLKLLLADNVKKIALANPKTAPYGQAAEELLRHFKLYDLLKKKFVYGESITQTNQFIMSQSADIGFTAKSAVLSDEMKGKGSWIELDHKYYSEIAQAAVLLKYGAEKNNDASAKFYSYLFSAEAKKIYKLFGYIVN